MDPVTTTNTAQTRLDEYRLASADLKHLQELFSRADAVAKEAGTVRQMVLALLQGAQLQVERAHARMMAEEA